MISSETLEEIVEHVDKAHFRYGDYASTHEALGVLVEEMNELMDAIRANALESAEVLGIEAGGGYTFT